MARPGYRPRGLTAPGTVPRRVLIVSADIGEGHNAAGRALEEAIARTWPGCQVRWLDTLAAMGPGIAPMARAFYVMQVQRTPWMYDFFFSAIWRHRWFLYPTRRFIGSWCGRRMGPRIRAFGPDVIISTYPLGSAGLSWLRRHRQLAVPAGAWVSDFCPHPYWVYRDLDVTFVAHPAAVPVAERADPGTRVAVGALPVTGAFAPGDRLAARARLGLDRARFVVLLSTGSLAFGGVGDAVTALLAAGPQIQVVAVCGHNERLRRRLSARREPDGRLRVVGWTDDMPGWIAASNVVVTNAGGVIAMEAMACGRPVIMFEPIAGHGRANAALMDSSGTALLARSPAGLTAAVSRHAMSPAAGGGPGGAALAGPAARQREDDLARLAAMPGRGPCPAQPARAEDALFLHVQTGCVPQQVGAVVMLAGPGPDLPRLRAAVGARVRQIPQLRRRVVPASGRWARARWVTDEAVDIRRRITQVTCGADGTPASLHQIVSRFFAAPLDPSGAAWQVLLVHGLGTDTGAGSAVVVKLHHALGDSYALISALSGLLDPAGRPRSPSQARRRPARARAAAAPRRAARVVCGLVGMSLAGRARRACINGPAAGPGRRFATVRLGSRDLAAAARRLGGSQADLLLALVADGLGRMMARRGEPPAGCTIRAMMPRTLRAAGDAPDRGPGNRAAGVLIDLPVGPMPPADRVAAIRALRHTRLRRGDADAAAFVLRAMNLLPPPLQRAFARRAYSSRRFNLIVSVFPGARKSHRLLGAEVTEVYPVLALADGVGLAVGAMTWGRSVSIGLLADEALVPDLGLLAGEIKRAFGASQRAAGLLPVQAGPRHTGPDETGLPGRRPHPGGARRAGRPVPAGQRSR